MPERGETSLEMAVRHVAEARRIVAQQRERITRLRADGRLTVDHEKTLEILETALRIFEQDERRVWFHRFLKSLIVVLPVLIIIDWLAGQNAKSWTNIPNAPAGWASLSSNLKIRSAMANESPQGTAPLLDESFLPGDIEYENPKQEVVIYFQS